MAKINKKAEDTRLNKEVRLAGGFGAPSAVQGAEALLRRAVMACLMWEDTFYESGKNGAENVAALIAQVAPETVAEIAVEARNVQKLRHVPLYIAAEMAKLPTHRPFVQYVLSNVIQRPDELTEFLAIYWRNGKTPIAKQVKLGLANAFQKFNAYQLAKYNRDDAIKLRDVLFMVHAKPKDDEQADLWKQLVDDQLPIPGTWENRLSAGEAAKDVFVDLMQKKELGALAFLRNLRKMNEVGVPSPAIKDYFKQVNSKWLLPVNYMAAAREAPMFVPEIETLMLDGYSQLPKLPGHTVFLVDRSGSMGGSISGRSTLSRQDVANAMAVMAREVCESVSIYATAGNDGAGIHATELVPAYRGLGLIKAIEAANVGGGGIFTRQCLEYVKGEEKQTVDRIIIFSDSQDCDHKNKVPTPFGKTNYIVDVSSHAHGINYKGVWTAEISGWSEHFLTYIAALEGLSWAADDSQ